MALIKRLKNTSGSARIIINRSVANNGYYLVTTSLWFEVLDDEDLLADILTGDITVNDGTSDLSASSGLVHLLRFQAPDVSVAGTTFSIEFGDKGSFKNEWAEITIDGIKSHQTPQVIPFNCKLVSIVYSNGNNSTELDIELYKNGLEYPNDISIIWEVRNAWYAYKTNGLGQTFNAGDRLACYVYKQGSSASNGYVRYTFQVSDDNKGEGYFNK